MNIKSENRNTIFFTFTILALSGCAEDTTEIESTNSDIRTQPLPLAIEESISSAEVHDDGEGTKSGTPAELTRRPSSVEELELIKRIKSSTFKDEPLPPIEDPSTKTLAAAASKAPDESMRVIVELVDPLYDFRAFAPNGGIDDQARADLVLGRKNQLHHVQNDFTNEATKIGATIESTRWLINQVIVTISAKNVENLTHLPNVTALHLDESGSPFGAYTGRDARIGANTQTFVDHGRTAKTGSRSGGPIRVGFIDSSFIPYDHSGFSEYVYYLGTPFLWSKLIFGGGYYDCTGSSCVHTTVSASSTTHGTVVAYAGVGSIEDGQDQNFTGTNTIAQQQRSGQASGARIYYYKNDASRLFETMVTAIEQAVSDGVDIINISSGIHYYQDSTPCSATKNVANFNEAMRNATTAGILFVNASGNSMDADTCTLGYPSWRPETLGVTGLNTSYDGTNYKSTSMSSSVSSWSQGPIKIGIYGNPFGYMYGTGVTLSAPGVYDGSKIYDASPNSYGSGTWTGSSFAAPTVAGAAALLKSAFYDIGWGSVSPRVLYANMLTQADGWSSVSNSFNDSKMDKISGGGRLNMHYPSSENLAAPWGWGWRSFTIHDDETVTWPVGSGTALSSSIKEWSWALAWFENSLTSVSDIDILVFDTCSPGSPAVAYDLSYDIRTRISLKQSDISGKCLEMRAVGYSVPPSGTTVYSADFFHSGTATFAP